MSIIAVEKTDTQIKFISDTQITYANQAYVDHKKIITVRNLVVGIAGKAKVLPLIQRYLSNHNNAYTLDSEQKVIELIQNIEKDVSLPTPLFTEDVELLITDNKNIWLVHPQSLTVMRVKKFEAIGSGANYAIGAYKASSDIKKAVEIACECNINCSLPLYTEVIEL